MRGAEVINVRMVCEACVAAQESLHLAAVSFQFGEVVIYAAYPAACKGSHGTCQCMAGLSIGAHRAASGTEEDAFYYVGLIGLLV